MLIVDGLLLTHLSPLNENLQKKHSVTQMSHKQGTTQCGDEHAVAYQQMGYLCAAVLLKGL